MSSKLTSFVLLGFAFGVGAMTTEGPAISAGAYAESAAVTLVVTLLLACGVYGWYRIVKEASEQNGWKAREWQLAQRTQSASAPPAPLTIR